MLKTWYICVLVVTAIPKTTAWIKGHMWNNFSGIIEPKTKKALHNDTVS